MEESETKYRRIEATSVGFLELDLDYKIIDSNATIVGLTRVNGKYGRIYFNTHSESLDLPEGDM